MKKPVLVLILWAMVYLPVKGEDIEGFFHLGMGVSFLHTQGKFSETGIPQGELSFVNQTDFGAGATFAGIGLGLKWVNFASPYTQRTTKRLFIIYLGGMDIGYYQSGEEKLFDISLSNRRARLLHRGKFFLDLKAGMGFRYWRISTDQPSLYQVYISFSLVPGYSIQPSGNSTVFVE